MAPERRVFPWTEWLPEGGPPCGSSRVWAPSQCGPSLPYAPVWRAGLEVSKFDDARGSARASRLIATEIAGRGANAETQELARQVAEAQIDLRRVRYARHQFLSDTLSMQYYDSYANMRMRLKVQRALLRPNPPDMSIETLKFATSRPQGPHKLATILLQEAKKLLAMDRYERRALARRKFAIRPSMRHELEPRPWG